MSVSSRHLLTYSPSRLPPFRTLNRSPPLASPNLTITRFTFHAFHFPSPDFKFLSNFALLQPSHRTFIPLKSYQSHHAVQAHEPNSFSLDSLLSFSELLCIVSSAIVTLTYVLSCTVLRANKTILGFIGGSSKEVLLWGLVTITCGMAISTWIRRRQWQRIFREPDKDGKRMETVNLVERVEKLEEDLKSSTTIIRVLSRQLEKLGIRFRVTRKALKQPIAETAALAQKNSEATRALAVQEDILEKELGEIQKVLLAMQEQQQKQLDLILAIAKTGKLWESKWESSEEQEQVQEQDIIKTSDLTKEVKQLDAQETHSSAAGRGNNNDKP